MAQLFGGGGPALVALALEMSYKLQVLAGVTPGIEFSYAIASPSRWEVICGDAPARDTVANLYRVFESPMRSLLDSRSSINSLITRVLFPPTNGVNIPKIFLSEPRRMQELARLTLPAVIISCALGLASTAGASVLEATPVAAAISQGYATSALPLLVAVGQTLAVSYLIVSTLRFLKVLVADRDRILAQSILDTVAKKGLDGQQPRIVCAVVGLLHVNGIVRHIQRGEVDPASS